MDKKINPKWTVVAMRDGWALCSHDSTYKNTFDNRLDAESACELLNQSDQLQARIEELEKALGGILNGLPYRKCPTCGGSGIMHTGRPNGDDHWTQKDAKGRDIPVGGGGAAMRMGIAPCTTCPDWNAQIESARALLTPNTGTDGQ